MAEIQKCKTCQNDSECDYLACSEIPGPRRVCNRCFADLIRKSLAKCSGIDLKFCRKDSDCGGSCSCEKTIENNPLPLNMCVNRKGIESAAAKCTTCAADGDCPNSTCLPSSAFLRRRTCEDCQASITGANVFQCSSGSGNGNGSARAPCVSTAWLRQNGLADATIRHGNSVPVLCIPGLPCGTHGHLLRDADSNLVSYREACERRSDCVASTMPVSQLSHTFDWSTILSSDGELSLTSLSANPDSKTWSV